MRKNIFLRGAATVMLLAITLTGCRKVDDDYQKNRNVISVLDYATTYFVGDTAIFRGTLFASSGQLSIVIGGVDASIVATGADSIYTGTGVGLGTYTLVDRVAVPITAEMKVGSDRSVVISNNGFTIYPPPITIQQYGMLPGQTDTTLVVKKLLDWVPTDADSYNGRTFMEYGSVSRDGDVYFFNSRIVAKVVAGKPDIIFDIDKEVMLDGTPVTVQTFNGMAVSFDSRMLYVSCQTAREPADDDYTEHHRLFRYDLATRQATSLNATIYDNSLASGGFKQGRLTEAQFKAINLKTDESGNLYFANVTSSPDYGLPYYNICRLDPAGQVKSLFVPVFFGPPGNVPGVPIALGQDYMLVPGKSQIVVMSNFDNGVSAGLTLYDLNDMEPVWYLPPSAGFRFQSYETNPLYQASGFPLTVFFNGTFQTPPGATWDNNLYMTALPNGELLQSGASLSALNITSNLSYCYAGTEAGLLGSQPADQINEEGAARLVNFAGFTAGVEFLGVDKKGTVYYFRHDLDVNTGGEIIKIFSLGKP